ncbi:hypothetical protein PUNSTDRAFT_93915 [Punctularia strigosozonata HHB-11173 SS5]|uniref:Carboxymuconolactone decarboxylase-like domain-containing protein n=1 Tax=Punctularia strigosozonata (strain HHB-11173) TaxID=741275 RepID=R7S190_PUNST|nr:uncharacterized protein PUNSTDRAFT_93915 [Punctularia strigosozonata HHB-11173 SS5]EIN03557.1 hypothetical protein PUNSTDRAFT_93915 [Punctularia strigosozonata HHB-11173 SS5]
MTAELVDAAFLSRLEALYPSTSSASTSPSRAVVDSPWYVAAAVAYSAANRPEAVPRVFEYVLAKVDEPAERLRLARKLRDALFKSGIIGGYPKAINGMVALSEATPDELRDKEPLRDMKESKEGWFARGEAFFGETYGETAKGTSALLNKISPDFGYFCIGPAYGFVYSFEDILSKAETSYMMISGLVAIDCPRQINWHLSGAVRNGATVEQTKAIRQIAMEVAQRCGVSWQGEVPDL